MKKIKTRIALILFIVASIFNPLGNPLLRAEADFDFDKDGLSDVEEIRIYYTDPKNPDTDGDGYSDGQEVIKGYDPLQSQGEKIIRNLEIEEDFIRNWQGFEKRLPTFLEINAVVYNKRKIDLEKKLIEEFAKNNPRLPLDKEIISGVYGPDGLIKEIDSDNDGLIDDWEIKLELSPVDNDFDKDGNPDGLEVKNGYDPKSPEPKRVEKIIKINLQGQKLAYYFDKIKLEEFLISSGTRHYLTPKGNFKILAKVPSKTYGGRGYNFYYPETKWNLHFYTGSYGYYIHGAYWHNNFGRPMSHGCINVAYKNMEKLYDWAQVGTRVEIE